ncbi:hypothetical protein ASF41_23330 [Methylobacterium sp. Leaf111]|nr:hypothetical protein ASF41_23330 [Methylobacterium sp. Leaf111]
MCPRQQAPEPLADQRIALAQSRHRGPSALNQHLAQVLAAAFCDPEEAWSSARCDLTRHEAEPGRQITSAGEGRHIADRRDQRCSIECADARDGGEPACAFVGPSLFGELCVEGCDASVEGLPAIPDVRHEDAHPWREVRDRLGIEQIFQASGELGASLRDDVTALPKDGADLVHQGRAFADKLVPHPVQGLHVELCLRLQCHEPHGRTGRGLRDRLSVAVVILLSL